jgi:beta-glucosidase
VSEGVARRLALADFDSAPEAVAFSYADGPNGIRGAVGATMFPSTLAIAAAGDRPLAEHYGRTVAGELFAAGHNVLLGPGLDITRDPRAGRMGESMGEDPLLVGELAGHVIRGVHASGALCVLKHFVANSVERLRTGTGSFPRRTPAVDAIIDDATLHELYLAPFRHAIERHGALGLMTSYNRLNGEYPSQSPALLALPRRLWGFTGVTVPDFIFAVRDPAAALRAGLDLPGLDGAAGRTEAHLDEVGADAISGIAAHITGAAAGVGLRPADEPDASGLGTAAALELAERILIEGSVLLRNEGALPAAPGARIALIGPDAAHLLAIGGSASVTPSPERIVGLGDALRAAGFEVVESAGSLGAVPLPVVTADATVTGIRAHVTDALTGDVVELDLDTASLAARPAGIGDEWSAEIALRLRFTSGGMHRLAVEFAGEAELLVDGQVVATGAREASPMIGGPFYPLHTIIERQAGDESDVVVRYRTGAALVIEAFGLVPHVALGTDASTARIADAARTAAAADLALVITGRVSGETMDIDDLRLPGDQEALIAAVAEVNPRTVVVTASANPVVAPWREQVAGIVHVWQPGERFGPALAAIVSGAAEPGGRLPVTVPATVASIPIAIGDDETRLEYTEGTLVGYRGYEAAGVEPAYWFGHGLGYAQIAVEVVEADATGARVRLTCGPDRGGKAVVQLYGRAVDARAAVFCGWHVARLEAGESREVQVSIDLEALARWRAEDERLVVPAGPLELLIGRSRGDIVATRVVELAGGVLAPAAPATVG